VKYTAEQIEKVFGEKLDSTNFTWQYYCGTRGVSVLTILDMETSLDIFNPRFTCEGWCYGDSLLGGFSKPNGIAVMLWDKEDEERVWCHISSDLFDTLYIGWQLKNNIKNN